MKLLSVDEGVEILKSGGVIAVPTETVYGLAAIAGNKNAVQRVFEIKNRPGDNPLICHFHSFEQAKKYLLPYPAYVDALIESLSPGPVSLLLKLKNNSELSAATLGGDNIVIRIPAHPLLLELLRKVQKPIAAPSANTSGRYSATNAAMVDADLGDKIDGIIDGGECVTGIESTILDCRSEDEITILRPGAIGVGEIRNVLGEKFRGIKVEEGKSPLVMPGSKYKHYAPATPVVLIHAFNEIDTTKKFVLITTNEKVAEAKEFLQTMRLLSLGNVSQPETIAKTLYRKMFELDTMKAEIAYLLIPAIINTTWRSAITNRVNKMVS